MIHDAILRICMIRVHNHNVSSSESADDVVFDLCRTSLANYRHDVESADDVVFDLCRTSSAI